MIILWAFISQPGFPGCFQDNQVISYKSSTPSTWYQVRSGLHVPGTSGTYSTKCGVPMPPHWNSEKKEPLVCFRRQTICFMFCFFRSTS